MATINKLDRYDLNILAELQRDARISNQELAERIGLSPSPCSRRVKQLEDDGYILRQVALLDRKKLGLTLTAYVQIGMDRHTPERFEHFESVINQCPEVLECSLVTGQAPATDPLAPFLPSTRIFQSTMHMLSTAPLFV